MPDLPAIAMIHAHHRHQIMHRMSGGQVENDPAIQRKTGADFVAEFDSNADGGLSVDEFAESIIGQIADDAAFGEVDTDGDGLLSAEEIDVRHEAAVQARADWTPAALAMMTRPSTDV